MNVHTYFKLQEYLYNCKYDKFIWMKTQKDDPPDDTRIIFFAAEWCFCFKWFFQDLKDIHKPAAFGVYKSQGK